MVNPTQAIRPHTIAVLVDNEPGVLARVVGLFSGRGYNIESLTVAEIDAREQLSRITIVTSGTPEVITQIQSQLERLIPVREVCNLTMTGDPIERELALARVTGNQEQCRLAMDIAKQYRVRIVRCGRDSVTFECVGGGGEVERFVEQLRGCGLTDLCRTGVVALSGITGESQTDPPELELAPPGDKDSPCEFPEIEDSTR